jgi:hypothetical protein
MIFIFNRSPDNISDTDIAIAKGLFAATNVLFILAWLLASAFNKASISDMDMDPEDQYDGINTEEGTEHND